MTTTENTIVIKTADQLRRAKDALAETHKQIAREMGYSQDLRNNDLVKKWQDHVNNLEHAIDAYPTAQEWPWTFEEISQDTYADLLNRGAEFERMDDEEAVSLFSWFDRSREVAFRVVGGGNVMWVVR